MAGQEINELNTTQSKKRMMMIGIVVAVVVVVGLGYVLMRDPNKLQEFSIGSECAGDCGVYRHQGWICLKDQKYCTRPCGENHPECPEGFRCSDVPGAPRTTTKDSPQQLSNYCLK